MKKHWIWSIAALLVLGLAGCKKEAPKPADAPAPAADAAAPAAAAPADAAAPAADAAKPAEPKAVDAAQAGGQPAQADAGHDHDHEFAPRAPQVPAPADVAAPPADAIKTATGLAYKKLVANDAGKAVGADDLVSVRYTGWTTDGKTFDTNKFAPKPTVFSPGHLIPGMKEGLQLAKVGESVRFWIPEDIAYGGMPGRPAGMLVFDFEILDVTTPVMPPKDIPEDAVKLDNGLAYRIVKSNPGAESVGENDIVSLDFDGWVQATGERFQSSAEIDGPIQMPVQKMFPGWQNVMPHTHVGDEVQIWVPQALGITPDGELEGTLIFNVRIVDKTIIPPPPAPPADVAAPGPDTQKTASGIAWRIVKPGVGTDHPTATSTVKVHYSGWTTDGKMFDSSVVRGEPIEFGLNQVIAGWTEALQLMVVGEKRIIWIPEELAYKGRPGAPAGMLVFEVELLGFH